MKKSRLIGALACAAALSSAGTAAAADTTVTVLPGTAGWTTGDTRPDGVGAFVAESGSPLGAGNFSMSTPSAGAKVQLLTTNYAGVRLDAIDELSYHTYRDEGAAGVATPAINLVLDHTGDGVADTYMVWEPYQDYGNAAILTGTWQEWDTIRGGAGTWWLSHPGASGCGQSADCSFATILSKYPDAVLATGTGGVIKAGAEAGSLGVNLGSGNAGVSGAADGLAVTIAGDTTTYDFEPAITPATKDDCKNGGWAAFNAPAFGNQGECVSSFAPGRNK